MNYDIIVREQTSGHYTYIDKIKHDTDVPMGMKIIARNVSRDEANAIMKQYPQATRMRYQGEEDDHLP